MYHIKWIKNGIDTSGDNNYTQVAFSFNDSGIWLAYGLYVSLKWLKKFISYWKEDYQISKVSLKPIEEVPTPNFYILRMGRNGKKPEMMVCDPSLDKNDKDNYKPLDEDLKRDLFRSDSRPAPPEPRRKTKKRNRDRILLISDFSEIRKITDEEWEKVQNVIPLEPSGLRPRFDRRTIDAILWMLTTGGLLEDIPRDEYGPFKTTYNRMRKWRAEGTLLEIGRILDIDVTPLMGKRYY